MPELYLYQGALSPSDVSLRDPTTAQSIAAVTGTASGTLALSGACSADLGQLGSAAGALALSAAASAAHGVIGPADATLGGTSVGSAYHGVTATAAATLSGIGSAVADTGGVGLAAATISLISAASAAHGIVGSADGVVGFIGEAAADAEGIVTGNGDSSLSLLGGASASHDWPVVEQTPVVESIGGGGGGGYFRGVIPPLNRTVRAVPDTVVGRGAASIRIVTNGFAGHGILGRGSARITLNSASIGTVGSSGFAVASAKLLATAQSEHESYWTDNNILLFAI